MLHSHIIWNGLAMLLPTETQADDVNVWCHCTGQLTCFFSHCLSVCLLQQWETFSERSSSSQTLTQFDSNIAPADPVSQSLSMHGFTINGQTLTLSGSLCAFSLSVSFCMMIFQRAVCCISSALYVLWSGWFRFNTTAPLSPVTSTNHKRLCILVKIYLLLFGHCCKYLKYIGGVLSLYTKDFYCENNLLFPC